MSWMAAAFIAVASAADVTALDRYNFEKTVVPSERWLVKFYGKHVHLHVLVTLTCTCYMCCFV